MSDGSQRAQPAPPERSERRVSDQQWFFRGQYLGSSPSDIRELNTKVLQTIVFKNHNGMYVHAVPRARRFVVDENLRDFSQDAPLRLDVAVKVAFPAGGMTIKGLRKEIARGRLVVELIAGKHFTTLAAISRMRELCRVVPKNASVKRPEPRAGDTDTARIAQARLSAILAAPRSKPATVSQRPKAEKLSRE